MPIYLNPSQATTTAAAANSNEIDDHTSHAAKVKRTREQAYFNSYDFDAIEVLPYDEADDDDDEEEVYDDDDDVGANCNSIGNTHQQHSLRQMPFKQSQTLRPMSLKSQKRLQNASLSSKSNSSVPSSSRSSTSLDRYSTGMPLTAAKSSSAAASPTTTTATANELNYLQRLGALFKKSTANGTQMRQRAGDSTQRELVLDVRNCVNLVDENFLLPRAMLKYQSAGNTNSMPLTDITATTTTSTGTATNAGSAATAAAAAAGNGKLLQSKSNKNFVMSNANIKQGNTGFSMKTVAPTTTPTPTTTALPSIASALGNKLTTMQQPTAVAANSLPTPTKTTTTTTPALARTKKQSTSSTITTATTASLISHEDVELTKSRPPIVRVPTATTITTTASNSTTSEPHGRASSHQSHYSTDKSASSGYYSSNVCSTYSLDDHIYCEPVIDVVELNSKTKSEFLAEKLNAKKVAATSLALNMQRVGLNINKNIAKTMHGENGGNGDSGGGGGIGVGTANGDDDDDDDDDDDGNEDCRIGIGICAADIANKNLTKFVANGKTLTRAQMQVCEQPYRENLRVLETSIENLDRHLKNFPSLSTHDRIASFVQTHSNYVPPSDASDKQRVQQHLPTIMEGYDAATNRKHNWQDDINDDSLLDIDLDSFLLVNERHGSKRKKTSKKLTKPANNGIDNPSFLHDDDDEEETDNNYKCAKYINSCPEDAYRVESDILPSAEHTARVAGSLKRYEDQLHFQNTRELLEDVRDKIRRLSQSRSALHVNNNVDTAAHAIGMTTANEVPTELGGMITTLKQELETYLQRMNQHSELEIQQLCSGLSKNQHIVKMTNAFQRRHSQANSLQTSDFSTYEAIRDGAFVSGSAMPVSLLHQITTIRCASDPNFKMKRKSLTEVFPISDCYIETITENISLTNSSGDGNSNSNSNDNNNHNSIETVSQQITQLQRNLSFHKPMLSQLDAAMHAENAKLPGSNNKSHEKDSLASWHRKKPSIWEMYYGTNRLNQTLLGKRGNGVVVNSNQVTLSYPSSRPESDFTLDLPRAEQLRIKMEKEKKFRQRCRYITTFLSLIFFLLTVMVVSLVLTRGKRMFGSMI